MINFESSTDVEWRQKLEKAQEEATAKLVALQKELDSEKYLRKNLGREATRLEYLLTYVLGYFLNERKIEISPRDLDLFYLKDIIAKYHISADGGKDA